jgi:gluconate kinase
MQGMNQLQTGVNVNKEDLITHVFPNQDTEPQSDTKHQRPKHRKDHHMNASILRSQQHDQKNNHRKHDPNRHYPRKHDAVTETLRIKQSK